MTAQTDETWPPLCRSQDGELRATSCTPRQYYNNRPNAYFWPDARLMPVDADAVTLAFTTRPGGA